jgi:hypothetical protein
MLKLLPFALLVASVSLAQAWSPRASEFQTKQAAERKRLGLDGEKARKAYPTPEVSFGGGTSWACPGESTTLLLQGKLATGTLVGTANEGVEIVKEQLTPQGWQATLKVKPGTRGPIRLELIAPVSGIRGDIELPVGCPREWVIELKTGERLVLQVLDGAASARGEWFKGNKSLDTHAYELLSDGKTLSLTQQQNADDRERSKKAQEGFDSKTANAKQQELTVKMQACANLPPMEMSGCMQKYSAELQGMIEAQQSAVETAQTAAAPKVGCGQLQGTIEGKKLKGNGSNCAGKKGMEAVPFTGVIR